MYMASGGASSLTVNILLAWGPVIFAAVWWVVKRVIKSIKDELITEKEAWRDAFLNEREAHEHTREALAKAEERATIMMDIAKPLTYVLHTLGHNPGDRSS